MYLKSIEVQGFKSFANKIVFEFNNGITGIVGPNGSGKSNVADAVRWVLGEQRIKQLRGASMQDVIFSGTQLRKPVGSAYVAITLDNSDHQLAIDYEEVTVARRIYRSGESEYLINGSVCRLKDVNELFYDTGIGKEGYSIIGQGQIDKILSSKPEDRRELFDEAAGIVKYKRRKLEAVRKLENERNNLVRVSDILHELDKQIGPLEKQSEKAKIYLKKKEEQKELDVNIFLKESKKSIELLDSLSSNTEITQHDLDEANKQSEALKREYESVIEAISELEKEIEESRNSLASTDVLQEKLEGEIKLLQEKIRSAKENYNHLDNRIIGINERKQAVEAEKDTILSNKSVIDEETGKKEAEREKTRAVLLACQTQIEEINNYIEESKNRVIALLNERSTIKSEVGRLDTMLEQKNIRLSQLNADLLRAKTVEEEQNSVIEGLEKAFEDASLKITELNQKQSDYDALVLSLKNELIQLDETLREKQNLFHQEKSKLDAITNLTERYEGYGGSIKKVMEQKGKNPGIIGVVADIIKVDKKYEVAIETALGGNIQNIVTKDEATAKQMIHLLKQEKGGRATFLPLDSITNPQEFKNPEALKETGVLGMADELVKTDELYRNVAKAMLGRIVVVDDVDHALKIARKFDYGIRMVTLEGELLVPGGAISGGAFRNNSNLLGRRREMDELTRKVEEIKKQIEETNLEIDRVKQKRNEVRQNIADNKEALQKAFIEQNTARLNVMQAKEKIGDVKKNFDSLKKEEKELEILILSIKDEKEKIKDKLLESEKLEKEETDKVVLKQEDLKTLRIEESEILGNVSELDTEVQKLLQRQGFEQEKLNRTDEELLRLMDELKEINENRSNHQNEIEEKTRNIEEIRQTIEAGTKVHSETKEKLDATIRQKEELSVKQKEFFGEQEQINNRISGLDKELFRLKTQKEKCEESMASYSNYMWQEYEITLHDAKEYENPELTDLSAMKKELAQVKDSIKKLGDVNVNAIEDYKQVSERHTFLKAQHDDLIEAEKQLVKLVEELDDAMRTQFEQQFARITEEFDNVFKELFGGGKATLELMEDEDILEAGIKINAQPPGKKLQNMMQLSGGEKALTAISLLFAIQNLKPSPFCLLDEIEAALDESNVDRFAKYLHKMTKSTQFIVITHRRGTMDQANQLYGITMQEKGVSALVSVDLVDKDLDN